MEVQELHRMIQDAIGRLPEKCRQIYYMSKLEHLSNREIAERLGISVKTVVSQVRIALRRLRSRINFCLIVIA